MNETPRLLMVPAAMVAYVTYRAGMRPPGRFWDDDKDGHAAGQPVKFPASYACFTLLNATAFYTSLLILVLLSSQRLHGTPARMAALGIIALFDLLCFASAFVFGSSPDHPFLGFAILLAGPLICVLVYSGVVITDWAKRKIAGGNEQV